MFQLAVFLCNRSTLFVLPLFVLVIFIKFVLTDGKPWVLARFVLEGFGYFPVNSPSSRECDLLPQHTTRVVFVVAGGSRGTSPSLDLPFPPTGLSENLGGMEMGRGGKGER